MIDGFTSSSPRLVRTLVVLGVLLAAVLPAVGLLAAAPASAMTNCTLVASSTGSDSASGTASAPFRTAQHLINALGPGQTGCLRAGTYSESLRFNHGGAAAAPLILTSYPGERATVVGRLYIPFGSNNVTISALSLDGRNASNLPSPTVNSNDVTFSRNDITNKHTAICFNLGDAYYGTTNRVLIERNRIHGCGRLPATNKDHGIYNEDSTDVTIAWNLIYDNADRGIQLYPNAQRTSILHNVIDGNGEGIIFSGDFGLASNNTTVAYNVISNSSIRHNVESWYPEGNPLGQNNMVQNNCLWGGAQGSVDSSAGGFTASNNITADPQFIDRLAGDFRMMPTSPCAALVGDVQTAADADTPILGLTRVAAAPSAASVGTGILISGTATDLATADLLYYRVGSSGRRTRTAAATASFSGVPVTASGLELTYRGAASAPCTQTLSLYRFSTGAWTVLDTRQAGLSEPTLSILAPPGSPSEYVASNGGVRFRVACSSKLTSFTLSGNKVELSYDRP